MKKVIILFAILVLPYFQTLIWAQNIYLIPKISGFNLDVMSNKFVGLSFYGFRESKYFAFSFNRVLGGFEFETNFFGAPSKSIIQVALVEFDYGYRFPIFQEYNLNLVFFGSVGAFLPLDENGKVTVPIPVVEPGIFIRYQPFRHFSLGAKVKSFYLSPQFLYGGINFSYVF